VCVRATELLDSKGRDGMVTHSVVSPSLRTFEMLLISPLPSNDIVPEDRTVALPKLAHLLPFPPTAPKPSDIPQLQHDSSMSEWCGQQRREGQTASSPPVPRDRELCQLLEASPPSPSLALFSAKVNEKEAKWSAVRALVLTNQKGSLRVCETY